jgi:hypothetical protein
MKKTLTLLFLSFLIGLCHAQENAVTASEPNSSDTPVQIETLKQRIKWELGIPLISRNNSLIGNYAFYDLPNTDFLNGIFIRATKKRFGIRFHAKYNEYSSETPVCYSCNDYLYVSQTSKSVHVETGAQYNLLRSNSLLYVYTDLYYQNIFITGVESGGIAGVNNTFSTTTNGIGIHTGLGSKIRLYKSLYLSPELGYNLSRLYSNRNTQSLMNGSTGNFHYVNMYGNMYGRLILSVQF